MTAAATKTKDDISKLDKVVLLFIVDSSQVFLDGCLTPLFFAFLTLFSSLGDFDNSLLVEIIPLQKAYNDVFIQLISRNGSLIPHKRERGRVVKDWVD